MTASHLDDKMAEANMADTPQKGAKQRIVFMGSPAFAIPTLDHLVKRMRFALFIASLPKNRVAA